MLGPSTKGHYRPLARYLARAVPYDDGRLLFALYTGRAFAGPPFSLSRLFRTTVWPLREYRIRVQAQRLLDQPIREEIRRAIKIGV